MSPGPKNRLSEFKELYHQMRAELEDRNPMSDPELARYLTRRAGNSRSRHSIVTGNGICREEEGDGAQVAGSHSCTTDDTSGAITFRTDESAFQPEDDLLPTSVPIGYRAPDVPSTEAAVSPQTPAPVPRSSYGAV